MKIGPHKKNEAKQKGETKHYKCRWCNTEFDMVVRQSNGDKHSTVSTQVKCPHCGNFLKTWE